MVCRVHCAYSHPLFAPNIRENDKSVYLFPFTFDSECLYILHFAGDVCVM